jgi:hypothetical protein
VWRPRVAKSGLALPSARLVSINIVPDVDAPSELGERQRKATVLLTTWFWDDLPGHCTVNLPT